MAGSPLPKRPRKPFELKAPSPEEVQRRRELHALKDLTASRRQQEAARRQVAVTDDTTCSTDDAPYLPKYNHSITMKKEGVGRW